MIYSRMELKFKVSDAPVGNHRHLHHMNMNDISFEVVKHIEDMGAQLVSQYMLYNNDEIQFTFKVESREHAETIRTAMTLTYTNIIHYHIID